MVTAWSGGEVLKNIEKFLKKSWKGIKINFKIPAYTLLSFLSSVLDRSVVLTIH